MFILTKTCVTAFPYACTTDGRSEASMTEPMLVAPTEMMASVTLDDTTGARLVLSAAWKIACPRARKIEQLVDMIISSVAAPIGTSSLGKDACKPRCA